MTPSKPAVRTHVACPATFPCCFLLPWRAHPPTGWGHDGARNRSTSRTITTEYPSQANRVVWVSGAVRARAVYPLLLRQSHRQNYDRFVEHLLALGAAGYSDREIAQRLTKEGFRSARSERVPAGLIGEIRRARGQISRTEQFRTQAKLEEQWTVLGLAQELGVHRNWLYTRIRNGTLPATRHSVVGHYLLPDDPALLATLRAQRDRCCYR